MLTQLNAWLCANRRRGFIREALDCTVIFLETLIAQGSGAIGIVLAVLWKYLPKQVSDNSVSVPQYCAASAYRSSCLIEPETFFFEKDASLAMLDH